MTNPTSGFTSGGQGTNVFGFLTETSARGSRFLTPAAIAALSIKTPPERIPGTAGIIREDNREYIRFMSLQEEISDTVGAVYETLNIPGRSEPIRSYSYTTPRKIDLVMEFLASSDALVDVRRNVKWLQSLVYPRYLRNIALPPTPIYVIIGPGLSIRGLVNGDISTVWKAPFTLPDLLPQYAKVSFSVELLSGFPPGSVDIRNS